MGNVGPQRLAHANLHDIVLRPIWIRLLAPIKK